MAKLTLHPYSFRVRMIWLLYTCTILASIISLIFAYVISHFNAQSEIKLQQQAIAVYMLELDRRTELPLSTIMNMLQVDEVHLQLVGEAEELPVPELRSMLVEGAIYTHMPNMTEAPVTYVQLQEAVVRIEALHSTAVFAVAFFRVIFSALSYMAVFALMIIFASSKISQPVHSLTAATARVQEGDFSVRLPEDAPGEVGELMRSFNDMTEALGSTAYLQKDFISSISHEFKTPIASIRGFAQLLQMPGLTEEQRQEYILLIAQESDRLSRLSETLLRLSALEQQSAPASLSSFSLDEQLRQTILRLEPNWSPRNTEWQLELDEIQMVSDEALLNHVWINLMQNAIKFSPADSVIAVRARMDEDRAVVEIEDHGVGMDADTVKRIFDRFYQADSSRRQDGVGLGLCLVKRILDMLGGSIDVASQPGQGSTFTVSLPIRPIKHIHPQEGHIDA